MEIVTPLKSFYLFVYRSRWYCLGTACAVRLQTPLRFLCPKMGRFFFAQLFQTGQKPFGKRCTIMDIQFHGRSKNLRSLGHLDLFNLIPFVSQ